MSFQWPLRNLRALCVAPLPLLYQPYRTQCAAIYLAFPHPLTALNSLTNRTAFRTVAGILFAALFAVTANAQASTDSVKSTYGAWDVVPFMGIAQHSPVGKYWGQTPDIGHRMIGVGFSTRILKLDKFSLSYAPNVVPLLLLTNVPSSIGTICRTVFGRRECEAFYQDHQSVFGSTISPLGLSASSALNPNTRLIFGAAAGMGFFTHRVPVPNSRKVNVVLEWGGALTHELASGQAVELGYKFHHISNAYTSEHNPGVDANLFYLGWKQSRTFFNSSHSDLGDRWFVSPFTGFAASARIGGSGNATSRVNLLTAGVQFAKPVLNVGKLLVEYNGNVAPLITVTGMQKSAHPCLQGSGVKCRPPEEGTVTGATVSPFGLAFSRANPGKLDFTVSGSVGGGLFSRSFPVPEAQKIKIALEWGPRIDYRYSASRSLQAGMKLYRLWSSYADENNPRIDANVFYVGFGWRTTPLLFRP